jgi:nitrile hydratase
MAEDLMLQRPCYDVGGMSAASDHIDTADRALSYWERSIHALLVILSCKAPPLLTTDELRRAVEGLEQTSYEKWGYYERWCAAMTTLLIERGIISENELNLELNGDSSSESNCEKVPRFQVGDIVRIKPEDSRLRWLRPHLRCPGYVFGKNGKIEKYVGDFSDPFLTAFRGDGPKQPLYRVVFLTSEIWSDKNDHASTSTSASTSTEANDVVSLDIYQPWLELIEESDQVRIHFKR